MTVFFSPVLADSGIFVMQLASNPKQFVMITLVVIFSICFHEYCHARMALWMGDSTAADRGHLTLNPVKQMGVISLIIFLILGFAWGSVPVDPVRLRSKHRWGELATSLAGPAANLLLFIVGWVTFGLLCTQVREIRFELLQFIFILGMMNGVLFMFNLLPVPGLDGWNAFRYLFPHIRMPANETMKGILVVLIFAAIFGVSYLFRASEWLMMKAPMIFASFLN